MNEAPMAAKPTYPPRGKALLSATIIFLLTAIAMASSFILFLLARKHLLACMREKGAV